MQDCKPNNLPRSCSGTISSEESIAESIYENGTILLILNLCDTESGVGCPPHNWRRTSWLLGGETLAAADNRVLGQWKCSSEENNGRSHTGVHGEHA